MGEEIAFKETQRLASWWWWIFILLASGLPVLIVLSFWIMEQQQVNAIMISPLLLYAGVIVLMRSWKLETEIKHDGIYARYFPFHRKARFFAWHELTRCYVRKYSPIWEFGGWGIRGISKKKRAWNVAGNMGIQLEMQDGRRLLIGTQKPQEAKEVLKRLGHFSEPSNL